MATRRDLFMPHLPPRTDAARLWMQPVGDSWADWPRHRHYGTGGFGADAPDAVHATGVNILDKYLDPMLQPAYDKVKEQAGQGAREQVMPIMTATIAVAAIAVGLSIGVLLLSAKK